MTATGREYREALTRMSNGDLLRAYGQAVLDNDGPGSRGFFQQQSIASELLRRMERKGADPTNPLGRGAAEPQQPSP